MVPVFAWAQTPSPGAADLLSAYRAALANDPQFASARAQSLAQLDAVFSDPDLGLGAAMDQMFGALGDVAGRRDYFPRRPMIIPVVITN